MIFRTLLNILSPFAVLGAILTTAIYSFLVTFAGRISRPLQDRFLQDWSKICSRLAWMRVHVTGLDNIPPQGSMYVFNHQSFLDISAIMGYVPASLRFGAKMELFKVPIFGWAMTQVGNLEIPRQNLTQAIGVYDKSMHRLALGHNFVLAPEGTRHKTDGVGMAPFKTGPFVLAIKGQAPIVPVVVSGIRHILPPDRYFFNYFGPRDVYVDILKPIETKVRSIDDREAIRDECRRIMVERFEQRQKSK